MVYRLVISSKEGENGVEVNYHIRSHAHHDPRKSATRREIPRRPTGPGTLRPRTSSTLTSPRQTAISRVTGVFGRNYGEVHPIGIAQAACATAAAPKYFKAVTIPDPNGGNGTIRLTDGAFGPANNPTGEGLKDIREAFRGHCIDTVVSIGTARKNKPANKSLESWVRAKFNQMTDSELVHNTVHDESDGENGFHYFRLNAPNTLDVELDEWKPKRDTAINRSGSITIAKMEQHFHAWASNTDNVETLRKCADKLVRRRRQRAKMDPAKWERYATGAKFTCPEAECQEQKHVNINRDEFQEHLTNKHGIMGEAELNKTIKECRTVWRYKPKPS